MKESYIVEATMRQKLPTESFSDFPELLLTSIEKLMKENVTFLEEASSNWLAVTDYERTSYNQRQVTWRNLWKAIVW